MKKILSIMLLVLVLPSCIISLRSPRLVSSHEAHYVCNTFCFPYSYDLRFSYSARAYICTCSEFGKRKIIT